MNAIGHPVSEGVKLELTVLGLDIPGIDAIDGSIIQISIVNQIGNGANFDVVFLRKDF